MNIVCGIQCPLQRLKVIWGSWRQAIFVGALVLSMVGMWQGCAIRSQRLKRILRAAGTSRGTRQAAPQTQAALFCVFDRVSWEKH
eukprot:1162108-Pelagomonas_calceolata.AAC.10